MNFRLRSDSAVRGSQGALRATTRALTEAQSGIRPGPTIHSPGSAVSSLPQLKPLRIAQQCEKARQRWPGPGLFGPFAQQEDKKVVFPYQAICFSAASIFQWSMKELSFRNRRTDKENTPDISGHQASSPHPQRSFRSLPHGLRSRLDLDPDMGKQGRPPKPNRNRNPTAKSRVKNSHLFSGNWRLRFKNSRLHPHLHPGSPSFGQG